jgi:hypothetical protein
MTNPIQYERMLKMLESWQKPQTKEEIEIARVDRRFNTMIRKISAKALKEARTLKYASQKKKWSKFLRRCYAADVSSRTQKDLAFIQSGTDLHDCQYFLKCWKEEAINLGYYKVHLENYYLRLVNKRFRKEMRKVNSGFKTKKRKMNTAILNVGAAFKHFKKKSAKNSAIVIKKDNVIVID